MLWYGLSSLRNILFVPPPCVEGAGWRTRWVQATTNLKKHKELQQWEPDMGPALPQSSFVTCLREKKHPLHSLLEQILREEPWKKEEMFFSYSLISSLPKSEGPKIKHPQGKRRKNNNNLKRAKRWATLFTKKIISRFGIIQGAFLYPPTETSQSPSHSFHSLNTRLEKSLCWPSMCLLAPEFMVFPLLQPFLYSTRQSSSHGLYNSPTIEFMPPTSFSKSFSYLLGCWKSPCISKWCSWQAEKTTSILSGRKGLWFPCEFIFEQNEEKLIASITKGIHITCNFKKISSLIYFSQIENNHSHLEIIKWRLAQ